MKQEDKEALQKSADALVEKTITLRITILKPTWWQMLRKQSVKAFQLQPASLGTLIKISREMLDIEISEDNRNNFMPWSQKLMLANSEKLARIIAYAIVNRKRDPSPGLTEFLIHNLTAPEMAQIAGYVIKQMEITSFISSIVSIKGMNILETSLMNQGS